MVVALTAGREEDQRFPGRNTFPLLGRPMMAYPILAAMHADQVDHVFLTTDSETMARIATGLGVRTLPRRPALQGASVRFLDVLLDALEQASSVVQKEPEILVVLLCNAPTVTAGMIDQGVQVLRQNASLDAVMSVSLRNELHPSHALRIGEAGLLRPYAPEWSDRKREDAYFPDALLWVVRTAALKTVAGRQRASDWLLDCGDSRVCPLVHQGYGDVDYVWQVPAIEEWLRRQGFSSATTPYQTTEDRLASPTASVRATPKGTRQRILITTVPFGDVSRAPLDLLDDEGIEYVVNPLGRRLLPKELGELIHDADAVIAGTEPITAAVMDRAARLRLISRVGIGLDSVDLLAAREREIQVAYTPEAPAPAVAEMTIGLMLSLIRSLGRADRGMRGGVWHRIVGRRLAELTVGVIGVGRVGTRVIQHLQGFGARILGNDLSPDISFGLAHCVEWVDKDTIYKDADIITLHVPLTPQTKDLITNRELARMKPDAVLINTARGGMVDEHALAEALREGRLAGAALDVFGQEPYSGELVTIENCILTCHMGSMSRDCRARMELEATQEVIRFLRGEELRQLVPEHEYDMQGVLRNVR